MGLSVLLLSWADAIYESLFLDIYLAFTTSMSIYNNRFVHSLNR